MKFKYLLVFIIIGKLVASSISERGDIAAIRSINSVREITPDLPDDMSGMLVVCDADETISQVCCMANNYEYGRQHKEVLQTQAQAVLYALTEAERAQLLGEYCEETDQEIADLSLTMQTMDKMKEWFAQKIGLVMESVPHTYSLTEEAWPEFFQTVRARGGKTIIVSSRKFDHHKGVSDREEPARIAFFEALGFAEVDMLYAGRECNYNKATRIFQYMSDAKKKRWLESNFF